VFKGRFLPAIRYFYSSYSMSEAHFMVERELLKPMAPAYSAPYMGGYPTEVKRATRSCREDKPHGALALIQEGISKLYDRIEKAASRTKPGFYHDRQGLEKSALSVSRSSTFQSTGAL
jgi:hypothetical protein